MSTARLIIVASFVVVVYGLVAATGQQAPAELQTETHAQPPPGSYPISVGTGSEAEPGQVYPVQGFQWGLPSSGEEVSTWGAPSTFPGQEFVYQAYVPAFVSQTGGEIGTLLPLPQSILSVPGGLRPLAFSPNTVLVELNEEQRKYLDHIVAIAQKQDPTGNWDRSRVVGELINDAMQKAGQSGAASEQP
ncbi:MAG: hypothetical protein IT365_08690 [Candidatus Hydrogenedentes bacterium]|nr:hypothetical protein [Candidatus Hydrogenedentota bacterium]